MYPLSFNKLNIIFLNHIDVVPAENCEQFTYPPFSGTIADGQVWGRGAIDSKGMAVMQLLANDPNKKVFTISTTFKRSLWLKLTHSMNTSGHGSVPSKKYVAQGKVRLLYKIVRWNRKVVFSKTTRDMFRELGRLEGGMRGVMLRNLGLFRPLAVRAMRKDEVIYSLIINTITITGIQTPPGPPNFIPQVYMI